jgi:hypothetical protein
MTARGPAWTDFELQCLYDVISDADWFGHASRLITRRSAGAIRTKMSFLRYEAGIVIGTAGAANRARPLPASNRSSAEFASARLLQRLIEVHAPPPPPAERDEVQFAFFIGPLFDLPMPAPQAELELAA